VYFDFTRIPVEEMPMARSSVNQTVRAHAKVPAGEGPDAFTPWIVKLNRWNMEMASLYGKRLLHWQTVPLRLLQCRTADELREAHEEFAEMLLADYRSAAHKLVDAVTVSVEGKESGATEAYATTLLKAQADAESILAEAKAQAQMIIERAQARSDASEPGMRSSRVA
jgi:hypothetical protein